MCFLCSVWSTCVHPSCSGVGVVQYCVLYVVFGVPVFTTVVVGLVLFNIFFLSSVWSTCIHHSCSGVGVVQYYVFCVVLGAPVFTTVVMGLELFNIVFSV